MSMASSDTKSERRAGRRALPIAIIVSFASMAPLLWALISSVRPGRDIFAALHPFSWGTIIPAQVTLGNYVTLLSGPFGRALLNTVIVTVASVAIGLLISSLAAFALAVISFPSRGLLFAVMVVSFLIPFEAIAIPLSATFRNWGLQNTYLGLILPGVGNGLAIFLLRQFFLGVPISLSEAARVDGLGWFGIYRHIYLPLSRGALVGAGIILFNFQWQAFLWPLLIAPARDMRVASVAIADFAQEAGVDFGQMFAGAVLAAAVPLVVLIFFEKQFTGALASSGLKE
jgi:putative chitobiose transport system permease protein